MEKQQKLQEKMVDLKNFSYILLAASGFFYLGLVLVGQDKSNLQLTILVGVTYLFLGLAFLFRHLSNKYQNILEDQESR